MPKPTGERLPSINGNKKRKTHSLKEFADVVYIPSNDIDFFQTEGKLLGCKFKNYSGRVNLLRIFPLSNPHKYISVRNADYEELGIIEDVDTFSEQQISLIDDELFKRYFTPKITKVIDAKEEFGNYFWVCETTAGQRTFTVRDLANNLIFMGNGAIALVDTDGNRYKIDDVKNVGAKAMKFLDIWI